MGTDYLISLREFITKLENISENGKNDNLRVILRDSNGECRDIGWCGIEKVFLWKDAVTDGPLGEEDCVMIKPAHVN